MKVNEDKHSLNIHLEPDTVEDYAILLRFGINALAEKPYISVSLDNNPHCTIYMRKRNPNLQVNNVNPKFKSR